MGRAKTGATACLPAFICALALTACGGEARAPRGLTEVFRSVECLVQGPAEASSSQIPPITAGWKPCSPSAMKVAYSRDTFWIRGQEPIDPAPMIVAFEWKTLSYVDLLITQEGQVLEHLRAGDRRVRSTWPLAYGDYPAFPLKPLSDRAYYFRLQSDSVMNFPITVRTPTAFRQQFDRESMVAFAYSGILLAITVLAILFAVGFRDSVYLYYGSYILFLWGYLNAVYGNSFRVFYPEMPWVATHIVFFSLGATFFSSILFFRKSTRLSELMPGADRAARILQILAVALLPLTLTDLPRYVFARVYTGLYLFAILAFLVLIVRLVFRYNQRSLILFGLGWGTYYLVTIVNILFLLNVVPTHPAVVFGPALMAPVEIVLFGGGLYERYRTILAEKERLAGENAAMLARLESFRSREGRYGKSRLGGVDVDRTLLRLAELMEGERLFRSETLTLSELAARLGVSVHGLSELLNTRLGLNFRQLLLHYRVAEAERLLATEPNKNMLEVAFEAGFNSKTAFNVGFKKLRGVSPSRFRSA